MAEYNSPVVPPKTNKTPSIVFDDVLNPKPATRKPVPAPRPGKMRKDEPPILKPTPAPRNNAPSPKPRDPKDTDEKIILIGGATEDESSTDSVDTVTSVDTSDTKNNNIIIYDFNVDNADRGDHDCTSTVPDDKKRSGSCDSNNSDYEPIWFGRSETEEDSTVSPSASFKVGPPKPPRVSEHENSQESLETSPPSFPPPPLPAFVKKPPPVPPRSDASLLPTALPTARHSPDSFDPLRNNNDDSDLEDSFEELIKVRASSDTTNKSDGWPRSGVSAVPISILNRVQNDDDPLYDVETSPISLRMGHKPPYLVLAGSNYGTDFTDDDECSFGTLDSCDSVSDGGDPLDNVSLKVNLTPRIPIYKTPTANNSRNCNKRGYLYKKDTRTRTWSWHKRWVVFDGDELRYYEDKKSMVSKRIIPVATMENVVINVKPGESKQFRFTLTTIDRVYIFAAETMDDVSLWTSTMMQSLISCRRSVIDGLTMHDPDKEGFLKFEDFAKKMFVVIKANKLCYYKTYDDYKVGSPIHQIDMQLCAVKELGKNKIQLMTNYKNFIFTCDSTQEMNQWKRALEESIAESMSDDTIAKQLWENEDNKKCADCGADGPTWGSFNFGICICKRCAGIHRNLPGNTIHPHVLAPKVRSATLDTKIWTPTNIKMFLTIGNSNANSFWIGNLSEFDRIYPDSDSMSRQHHIEDKYIRKKFCLLHHHHGNQQFLDEALCQSVQTDNLVETVTLLFSGAEMTYTTDKYNGESMTAYQLAKHSGKMAQSEFLAHNGADILENGGEIKEEDDDYPRRNIVHKGYIYKTGSNMKDFHKRWCMLERGALSYYIDEKSNTAKDTIPCRDMLNIGISDKVGKNSINLRPKTRYDHCLELGTRKCDDRIYMFATENETERMEWMRAIAKSFCPGSASSIVTQFDRAGHLYVKEGTTGEWSQLWIQIKGKEMCLFDKLLQQYSTVDLRKVIGIKQIENDREGCHLASEGSSNILLDLPGGRAFYMQGEMQVDTESWWNFIKKTVTEGGKSLEDQQLTNENVPIIIDKCIKFISSHGLNEEGIYRHSGTISKVNKLLAEFTQDARSVNLKLENYEVHDVANCMKRYLRTLSDPLLTSKLHAKWINYAGYSDQDSKLQLYKYLLKELPVVNYCTLKKLLLHLKDVVANEAQNKMSIAGLGSLFGPTSMKLDEDEASGYGDTNLEIQVLIDLISFNVSLFDVRDFEMKLDQEMKEAEQRIKIANTSKGSTDSLNINIYVNSKEGQCIDVKVLAKMTAQEVVDIVVDKAKLSKDNWSLHEVVCGGELERVLHHSDNVLEALMNWSNWHPDFISDNYVCIKENILYETIESVVDPALPMFSELRLRERRAFKKYCFEFKQSKLSYYKSAQASNVISSWNVEDLLLYVGVDNKTSPTKYCFTFIEKNEKAIKSSDSPFFGRSVACSNSEEYHKWLAGMIHAQYPKGLYPEGHIATPRRPSLQPMSDKGTKSPMLSKAFSIIQRRK